MTESVSTAAQGRNEELESSEVTNKSVRRASVIAGIGLLLMAVLAAFGELVVLQDLVTRGDATQTANNIMNSEGMFRLSIASLFLVAVLDVIVAWALFIVFEQVNRTLSLLAAWFRAIYAGILLVAISQLVGVISILSNPGYLTGFSTEQLHAQALLSINSYYDIWHAGLLLFGLHLLLLGYLAYRSEYVPKVVGILLVIAGLGYAVDSVGPVLSSGYTVELAMFTFVGEVVLIFWLLIKGRRLVLQNMPVSTAD